MPVGGYVSPTSRASGSAICTTDGEYTHLDLRALSRGDTVEIATGQGTYWLTKTSRAQEVDGILALQGIAIQTTNLHDAEVFSQSPADCWCEYRLDVGRPLVMGIMPMHYTAAHMAGAHRTIRSIKRIAP